jgi:hypothetical protein
MNRKKCSTRLANKIDTHFLILKFLISNRLQPLNNGKHV